MKKILVLTPDIKGDGGVANYYRIIELNKQVNVDYFYINSSKKQTLLMKAFLLFFKYIKFLILLPKYDLFHLNISLDFKSYNRDLGYVLLIRIFRKKFMCFFHGWQFDFEDTIANSKLKNSIFKFTIGQMSGCFVLGKVFKESLIRLGTNSNCKYWLETSIADNRYFEKVDYEQRFKDKEELSLLFISRVVESKGIYITADIQKKLEIKYPGKKVKLIFAGDGPDFNDFKVYVKREGITNIEFTGYVRDEEKHDVLNRSDILVFPTYYPEGLPCVILEAMLYGMPVISRINAGIPDVIEHGDKGNGYLSDSKDSGIYVDYISRLVEDSSLRIEMGKRNKEKALGAFVKEKIEIRVLNAYKELLG